MPEFVTSTLANHIRTCLIGQRHLGLSNENGSDNLEESRKRKPPLQAAGLVDVEQRAGVLLERINARESLHSRGVLDDDHFEYRCE